MRNRNAILVPAILMLTGCTAPEHMTRDYGYSYHHNLVVQQQAPAGTVQQHPDVLGDGQKMEQAIANYRKDKSESARERLVSGLQNTQ